VIELRGVHLAFDTPVLRGIDLSLPAGVVWGLIGPAASGKSVLAKVMCGLLRPDAGEVLIDGTEISRLSERALGEVRKKIGMLFQNNALFDFLDIGENTAFPLTRGQVLPEAQQSAIDTQTLDRLRSVGLAGSERKMPSQLSGGMRKRAGVARATVAHPPIVIYDEPTAGLDPVTTAKIYELLRKDQKEHRSTVVAISSDVESLLKFVDRVGMLHDGVLRYDGSPTQIADAPDPLVRQFVRGLLEGPL
jgi:phospholipid/cholesterol/gamma-HCH transport system ATP-binding protein